MSNDIRDQVPGMTPSEREWAVQKAHAVGLAIVRNVRASVGLMCAVPSGERRAPRAGTFVVVGAGPSLDHTAKFLPELRAAGAVIVAVNSAVSAVRRYVDPDVVVAREINAVGAQLDGLPPTTVRALDVGCSPAMFERCAMDGPTAWFVPATVSHFELAAILGVRPLYGGDSALTAAVALADAWGAAEVVLVGVDLAIGDDGAMYGTDTAFAGERATIAGAQILLDGPGHEARQAVADGGGVPRPPARTPRVSVPAYGGRERVTTQTVWVHQIEWLMQRAGRDASMMCIDATGAGAAKPAWYESSIEKVIDDLRTRSQPRPKLAMEDVPAGRIQAAVEWFERQATDAQVLAATVVDPMGCAVACPGLWDMDVVSFVAAAGQIAAIEKPGTILEKVRGVYGALGAAGADVMDALNEEQPDDEREPIRPRGNEMAELADVGESDPDRFGVAPGTHSDDTRVD